MATSCARRTRATCRSSACGSHPAQACAFNAGGGTFNHDETAATGLGPVFNRQSCSECHSILAIGGGGGNNRTVTRVGGV
jgi:hypothetical protein